MKTAHDVKLLNGSKQEVTYLGKETVTMPGADGQDKVFTAGAPIDDMDIFPDFSGGDMAVDAPDGYVVRGATVKKPETLLSENILNGVEIAGVPGMIGAPTVTIIDYDGTIIDEKKIPSGETYKLPESSSHDGLVFDGWCSAETITDGQIVVGEYDALIGPIYHTESGATEIDIILTKATGLAFTFLSVLTGMTSIDWGDGTTGSSLTHTYSDYGEYTIKIYGMTAIADGTSSGGIVKETNYMITSVRFPRSMVSIGAYAFKSCYSLRSVVIPNSVTNLANYCFQNCYSLRSIVIPSNVTNLSNCFYGCYALGRAVISYGVESIGKSAFYYCYSLESISIPPSVTAIGAWAFTNCAFQCIVIPSSVTTISSNAFSNCKALKKVVILDGVESIGKSAFYYCYSLESISIPPSVKSLGDSAFYYCYSLESIDIQACITSLPDKVFYSCYSLKSIRLPETLTSIGVSAFYECYALQIVEIPESVTAIGGSAFANCNSLRSIIIPQNVKSLGSSAFNSCVALERAEIKSGDTILGNSALAYCHGLVEIDFSSCSSVPTLSSTYVFSSINQICKILVPASLYSAWITATNWKSYANYIIAV